MAYRTMRSSFHEGKVRPEDELASRLALPGTTRLGFALDGDELFFTTCDDVYGLLLKAARLDKDIALLVRSLPPEAVNHYIDSSLIDEIVLTNDIEGVYSSRREISELLDSLGKHAGKRRFRGLVQKYIILSSSQTVPLQTCEDIRALYDDLVLDEVIDEKKSNEPDGELFRAGTAEVFDGAGRVIHSGTYPESRIAEELKRALAVLNDESIEPLVRVSVFHYLFGYIHPFYDGNGRANRFISSYVISRHYEPIVGLRLSYAVKENISKYYGAFSTCEHKLNKGDLTPFVIAFCEIVVKAMTSMCDSLVERKAGLVKYTNKLDELPECGNPRVREIAEALVVATLFSPNGLTADQLGNSFGVSRQTVYKRVDPLGNAGVLVKTKIGRKTFYTLDFKALDKSAVLR